MDVNDDTYDNRGLGDKTRDLLKKKGITSPSTKGMVLISKGLWVVPKKIKNIEKLKKKYKIK